MTSDDRTDACGCAKICFPLTVIMGLSGRKDKQRIGNDPRNLAWADDASKFGTSYLSKFGWDSTQGLGATGEGRLSHIKVSQKLDMLGIGAAQQRDPNGIAWKQNKDFERLLDRLNAETEPEVKLEAAIEGDEQEKKRKREDGDEKATKKKRRKSEPITEAEVVVAVEAVEAVKPVVPRHRAHRARAIAAKNIASKSAASIAEILGVAPSSNTSMTATPEGTLTPYEDDVPLEKLTTATKSVADYFKDKLLAKAGKSMSVTPTPSEAIKTEIDYDMPRGGLGSSRVKLEPKEEDEPPARMGLGLSKMSMMSSFFAASTSAVKEEPAVEAMKEEEDAKADKKRKSPETDGTGKRKDKKSKQRQDDSESTAVEEAGEKKKKKKHRRDKEEGASKTDPVDEDERKRAKKEKKRLLALEREQAVEKEEVAPKTESVDEDEQKRAKKERKRLKALKALEQGRTVEFNPVVG
ncbi:hypothetical protein K438DRAFT_1264380 [Mycena galopus ATCC 62051]|nr:hypothetical protein K438DRAFT_1264380 [Mycena galopus ATCC 62051]